MHSHPQTGVTHTRVNPQMGVHRHCTVSQSPQAATQGSSSGPRRPDPSGCPESAAPGAPAPRTRGPGLARRLLGRARPRARGSPAVAGGRRRWAWASAAGSPGPWLRCGTPGRRRGLRLKPPPPPGAGLGAPGATAGGRSRKPGQARPTPSACAAAPPPRRRAPGLSAGGGRGPRRARVRVRGAGSPRAAGGPGQPVILAHPTRSAPARQAGGAPDGESKSSPERPLLCAGRKLKFVARAARNARSKQA